MCLFDKYVGRRTNGTAQFDADVKITRSFMTGVVGHDGFDTLAAGFNMLSLAAGLRSRQARNMALDALAEEHGLVQLPASVKSSASYLGRFLPDTDHGRGLAQFALGRMHGVFFTLAQPQHDAEVFVAGAVRKGTEMRATPVFFTVPCSDLSSTNLMRVGMAAYAEHQAMKSTLRA